MTHDFTSTRTLDSRRLESNALDLLEFLESIAAEHGRNALRDMYVQAEDTGSLDIVRLDETTLTDGSTVRDINLTAG